jgi:hypothetical protein
MRVRGFALAAALTIAAAGFAAADGPARAPLADAAAAEGAPVKLLVRFAPTHPMAKAMSLAASGDSAGAATQARRALRQDPALAGLCFDDFTLSGAEVVLAPCAAPSPARAASVGRAWARHLRKTAGVVYVDQNVIVKPIGTRP